MAGEVIVAKKAGWGTWINNGIALLTAIAGAVTTILGLLQKLKLDEAVPAGPDELATHAEHVNETATVMGYGALGIVLAAALYFGGQYIPKVWAWGRAKFRSSSLDPKTKARVRRFVAENCLEGLRGVFEGDADAEERIRWLAQRAAAVEVDLKFPAPARGMAGKVELGVASAKSALPTSS